jgi:hypothetical protein
MIAYLGRLAGTGRHGARFTIEIPLNEQLIAKQDIR